MPWCPNCKNEHPESITECVDCEVTLVTEDINENQPMGEESLMNNNQNNFIEPDNDDILSDIDKKKINELDAIEQLNKYRNAGDSTYIKAEDQYKDYIFSAFTFLGFGILGILFVILNMTGIFTFLAYSFNQWIMLIVFILFIAIGVSVFTKASNIKSKIADEKKNTDDINRWLNETITKEYLNSLVKEGESEEISYFTQMEQTKERLIRQFGELDEAFIDAIIEEHLNNII